MTLSQSQSPKLFARDIVRYSDAELDQYLEANRRLVEVEDPKNLPEDFIQRLRARVGASDTAQSRPIDLDYLTALLEDISANRQAPPRPPSLASTISMDEEETYHYYLEKQTQHYNDLVNEGGRPSHPVSLGRNIIETPGEYREILSVWQKGSNDWEVFWRQLNEWRQFREWQQNNREEGRFLKYVEGVKGGLAEHGFMRSFQLDKDPEQQDKLTTWIEYLDYEYWWYDKKVRFVKRHQARYDEAWKKLLELQVLRPSETEAFIWNINSSFKRMDEEDRAERAVKSAKSAVISAQKAATNSRRSSLSQQELRQKLAAAESRLSAAVKSLESIQRRNNFISEFHEKTKNYQIAKGEVERRDLLLHWMLQQVPLIELELNPPKVAENGLNRWNGRKKRSKYNHTNKQQISKQQRKENEILDHSTCVSATKEREGQLKRSFHDPPNEGQASKRPKCNDQSPSITPHEVSDAANTAPIGEPVAIQPLTTQDPGTTTAKITKAHSNRHLALKKTESEVNVPTKGGLEKKAGVVKRGRESGKSSNLSAVGSPPLRRGTRMRKPPDRF